LRAIRPWATQFGLVQASNSAEKQESGPTAH
jgi:hypothetical protein